MPVKKITKADITDSLYEKTELYRTQVHRAVDLFIDEIKYALVRREVIELRGFGTFEVKVRKTRPRAHNPKTGEKMTIHPHGVVIFRPGRELKQAVWDIPEDGGTVEE
jgi:integration host factor subunit beta